MKMLINGLLLLALIPLSMPLLAADVLVLVGDDKGQGTLRKRGNECLVITPRHVTANYEIDGIQLVLQDKTTVSAELIHSYDADVAVLRPEPNRITRCKEQPFSDENITALLKNNARGTLRLMNKAGSTQLLPVDIVNYDSFETIDIKPRDGSGDISKGYSGGLLYIDRRPVGMLTSVNNGVGSVMQSTTLNAVLDPFFLAVNEASTLYIQADKGSRFLLDSAQSLAQSASFTATNQKDANFQLILATTRREIPSDTDKLVEYTTHVQGLNKLGATLLDKTLSTRGNSFVSLDNANENARSQIQALLEELDPFSYFD